MDELGRRLRRANPYSEQPLPSHAVETLNDIVAGRRTPNRSASRFRSVDWLSRPALASAIGILTIAALLAVITMVFLRPHAATATTPAPLPISPTDTTAGTLRQELARSEQTNTNSQTRRGAQWEGWFLQLELGEAPTTYIQPQLTEVEWSADLSGTSRVIAGTAMTTVGEPIEPRPSDASPPGSILYEEYWGPGEFGAPFIAEPPNTTEAMREYLFGFLESQGLNSGPQATAGEYLFALTALAQVWTLGSTAERAALGVIFDAKGIRVLGDTFDRAGRAGVVLGVAPTPLDPGYQSQLVVDTSDWRVLAVERITVDGLPEFDIESGSVTDYTLWR